MKQWGNFILIVLVIVALIFAALWMMTGGDLGKITASLNQAPEPDSIPPVSIPLRAEAGGVEALPPSGNADGNIGRIGGGGGGGCPTVAAGYIDRDWGSPVMAVNAVINSAGDLDAVATWAQNSSAVVATSKASFMFGVYPGTPAASEFVIIADNVDSHSSTGVGTVTYASSSNLWPEAEDGWLSEWQVSLPGSGRYTLRIFNNPGFGSLIPLDDSYWLVEVR